MVNIPQIKQPKPGAFKLKRHHGYSVLLFIFGTVFPPLAVAARFGIGSDFFLNLFLTICGYIPGHVHNFYIQNIRNNKNNRRTPKWAIRYGLISDDFIKKKKRKSEWANRYEERLPNSTYEGRDVDEGQTADPVAERQNSLPDDASSVGANGGTRRNGNALWREEDESFYSTGSGDNDANGRWHYPANFEDSEIVPDVSRKRRSKKSSSAKKSKRDRFERSEDAYAAASPATAPAKKRKSSTRRRSGSEESVVDGPEDPLGVGYGRRERERGAEGVDGYGAYGAGEVGGGDAQREGGGADGLAHEF